MSDENDKKIEEFHKLCPDAKEWGFGRVFHSPNLFEDMVKCMLLCNCQWPRTLSMVRALCELQLELTKHSNPDDIHIEPKTPRPRQLKRKRGKGKKATQKVETGSVENGSTIALDTQSSVTCDSETILNAYESPGDVCASNQIGDFPTPEELAVLSVDFLSKRCGLGYRAKRILLLAQSIVEDKLPGKLPLSKLEEVCDRSTLANFDAIDKQLSCISGFGPFTHANILMCMGFYNRIPVDTETVRHLRQFHGRSGCTLRTVQKDLEAIYRRYEPFQFLAYWSEVWGDYDKRFGEISKMSPSDYKLFTASNMRKKV